MIVNFKFLLFVLMVSFLACKGEYESWKVPVGYQNYGISLGDSYEKISRQIGELKLDLNSENSHGFKNYLKFPNQIEVGGLQINPIIYLRFNADKLVVFEVVYTIDETINSIDFQKLIEQLGKSELTEIDELINFKKRSIVNNEELWLRKINIDTTLGEYPKVIYKVHAIP